MLSSRLSLLPLRLDNISFEVDKQRLLDGVSVTFEAAGKTIIMGPNGAGKSLLLRVCHGLLSASSGNLQWASTDKQELRRKQALVFQRPVLLRRSVAANVAYALAIQGLSRQRRQHLTAKALALVGLTDFAKRPARVLSGGEQQRLALARAWAMQPQVLFLDEPTANLDPGATRAIETIIDAIDNAGCKIIMTTHDIGQAYRLADEVLFLHHGRLLEQTPAAHFFNQPSSPEAKIFLAGELLD